MPSLQIKDLEDITSMCDSKMSEYKYFGETGTYHGETTLRMQSSFEKIFRRPKSFTLTNKLVISKNG